MCCVLIGWGQCTNLVQSSAQILPCFVGSVYASIGDRERALRANEQTADNMVDLR